MMISMALKNLLDVPLVKKVARPLLALAMALGLEACAPTVDDIRSEVFTATRLNVSNEGLFTDGKHDFHQLTEDIISEHYFYRLASVESVPAIITNDKIIFDFRGWYLADSVLDDEFDLCLNSGFITLGRQDSLEVLYTGGGGKDAYRKIGLRLRRAGASHDFVLLRNPDKHYAKNVCRELIDTNSSDGQLSHELSKIGLSREHLKKLSRAVVVPQFKEGKLFLSDYSDTPNGGVINQSIVLQPSEMIYDVVLEEDDEVSRGKYGITRIIVKVLSPNAGGVVERVMEFPYKPPVQDPVDVWEDVI